MHTREMQARKIYTYGMHTHSTHAREIHTRKYMPMGCTPEITTLIFPQGIPKALAAAAWAMVVLDRKREEIKARAKNRRYLHPRAAWEHRSKNNNNNNNNDGNNNNNNNTTPHNEIAFRRGKHNTETATKHVLHV